MHSSVGEILSMFEIIIKSNLTDGVTYFFGKRRKVKLFFLLFMQFFKNTLSL